MFYFFRDAPDVSTRLAIYLYYRAKDWIRTKKEEAFAYKVIFLGLGLLVKVYLVIYLAILLGYCIAVSLPFLFGILSLITTLII